MSKKTKKCFVISPIGEDGSETRRRSDQVLNHIIKPVAKDCGYEAVRADEIDKPGLITSQVIQRVVSDELVVADLTETNPNVFYELAIRHAFRKPLVQIIAKGERIPFDVAGTRTIHFDHTDLDSVQQTKEAIQRQIVEIEKGGDVETPISVSQDLQNLKQSDNPADRERAELINEISQLRSIVSNIQDTIVEERNAELKLKSQIELLQNRNNINSRQAKIYSPILDKAKSIENKSIGLMILCSLVVDNYPWIYKLAEEMYSAVNRRDSRVAADIYNTLQLTFEDLRNLGIEDNEKIFSILYRYLVSEFHAFVTAEGMDVSEMLPF